MAGDFDNGVAEVRLGMFNAKVGWIDKDGKYLWQPMG